MCIVCIIQSLASPSISIRILTPAGIMSSCTPVVLYVSTPLVESAYCLLKRPNSDMYQSIIHPAAY
jgi:hypothetical protein